MIISRQREKLINAMIFFSQRTKHCHTLKLFKLLNFLDFEHFRQTGRTVTGLRYVAWPQGPVPNDLWHEMQHGGDEDLRNSMLISEVRDQDTDKLLLRQMKPRRAFDADLFSKRELGIMEKLAFVFEETDGKDMSQLSHHKNLPWKRVFGKGEGRGKAISPMLALESEPIIGQAPPSIDPDELTFRHDLREGL